MKSSRSLQLTLMMGAAATLTACSDTPQEQSFLTTADCAAAGIARELCQGTYEQALAEHNKTAPKFPSKEECERTLDVSQCTPTRIQRSDGSFSDVFVPAMAGFLIGKAMAKREDGYSGSGYYYGGNYYRSGPIYSSRDHQGSYRRSTELSTPGSRAGAPSTGAWNPPSGTVTPRSPNVNTTTISRQGFGSRGFSFGGGGS
jgi:uncharacterized protein YgiB involved in biofilm formation